MRVEESIDIRRAREIVWDIVSDPANDPRWCPKVKSVHAAGPTCWRVVHKPVPLRPSLDLVLEQLEVEPPARLRLRQEDGASVFAVEYRLEAIAEGTRFTQTSQFEWKTLPRLLRGAFTRGVRRDIQVQLRALKTLAEGA